MKKLLFLLSNLLLFSACGQHSTLSHTKEVWDGRNDPKIMGLDRAKNEYQYTTQFDQLARAGALKQTPWSDYYWPSYLGGLSYRWNWKGKVDNHSVEDLDRYSYKTIDFAKLSKKQIARLSPAEKYDLYMGYKDYRTTRAERDRTGILRRVEGSPEFDPQAEAIPTWEGLCHAWAPATLAFQEPELVTVKNQAGIAIPFGSSDVKGLLTMFLDRVQSKSTSFLGGRCENDFNPLQDQIEAIRYPEAGSTYADFTEAQKNEAIAPLQAKLDALAQSSACRDTNAGAFHIVLANQIAKMNEGFIVDVTRDDEVWNQAVFGFASEVVSTKEGASPGAAIGTVKEIEISTRMDYIVEVAQHWQRADYEHSAGETSVDYQYRLELNAQGEIIGGEWLGMERPDFLWKQKNPAFRGEFKGIEAIYQASIKAKTSN